MIGRTESKQLTNNVFGVALIFEGGGMRNSATAPVVVELLRNRIHFDWVAGISAGSTHLAKYLSRDQVRATRSFIHLAADPGYWKLPNLASGQRSRFVARCPQSAIFLKCEPKRFSYGSIKMVLSDHGIALLRATHRPANCF